MLSGWSREAEGRCELYTEAADGGAGGMQGNNHLKLD